MGVPRPERARFWKKHVEALLASDLGQREYCDKHGLGYSSLSSWRRRFEDEAKASAPKAGQLVPIQVVSGRRKGVEAAFRLVYPELGAVEISGDLGAVVNVLQLLRWEAV